ncbi:LysR family transcriptional regulator [Micromonospora sp. NPDC050200]|uniref:LysR family transcriptional regulator n=1 Tax=Micromonospora sp. NPDC050200 TaxID=3155664 RepID=UPI0033E3F5B5
MSDPELVSPNGHDELRPEAIRLEDLRVFMAVARSGSFRSAASQMFTSQPTMSRSIARLEGQLGVPLLERGPRGVQVTTHGEVLLSAARRVLTAMADLRHDVSTPGSSTLRLGATATSARTILAPFLSRWIPDHPDIHVTAIEDSERRLHSRLENGDCDVAIISSPISPSLDSLHITTVQVIALFPPEHRMSGTDGPVSVVDLADERLLVNGESFPSTGLLMRAMDAAGIQINVVYECSAGQTLAAIAEAGLGVAVFGDTADLRGFALRRHQLLDAGGKPLTFDLYAAWMRDGVPARIRDFAVELATSFRPARQRSH